MSMRTGTGRLEARTAAVVGVGSSIGRASASLFAGEGAHVLVMDSDSTAVHEVVATIVGAGGRASPVVSELGDAARGRIAAACEAHGGWLDVLFVCASAIDAWPMDQDRVERWEEVLRVNLLLPAALTIGLRSLLARADGGSVIYLGSIDGLRGNPNVPAYSVSKGGLLTLTRVMAELCGPDGTRVNCIAAGGIRQTPDAGPELLRPTNDAALQRRLTPLGRKATAEDIAAVALFFASEDSAYVSGAVLPVDGGRLATTPGTGTLAARSEARDAARAQASTGDPNAVARRALADVVGSLQADGYSLRLLGDPAATLTIMIDAGSDACEDCLVPKAVMQSIVESALASGGVPVRAVHLRYPGDPPV